jgi:hypothetical protein
MALRVKGPRRVDWDEHPSQTKGELGSPSHWLTRAEHIIVGIGRGKYPLAVVDQPIVDACGRSPTGAGIGP